jgi:hypothetical protein
VSLVRRRLLGSGLAAVLTATLLPATLLSSSAPAVAAPARQIAYRQWAGLAAFSHGRMDGVRVRRGELRLATPVRTRRYADPYGNRTKRYDLGRWTSPWVRPGFGLTQLVPSWNATTPRDSWLQVQVRGITDSGRRSSWDTIANWSATDRRFHRTSLGSQSDDVARVAVDTWVARQGTALGAWQLRLTLLRRTGTHATPHVRSAGAVASRLPDGSSLIVSRPGVASVTPGGTVLDVPRYSQMIHSGDYQEYGGGGEAWCSPTSTTMVLAYYDSLPPRESYAWVKRPHRNRFVDNAARMTYDYRYEGTGNWPFNAAYAGLNTDHAFVTRMRSLRDAERFIRAGIPVVASIAFGRGELSGAPIGASNGHLVVIVGFTATGDVVVNDPAAQHDPGVRRTYNRAQFENAWLPTSGGLAYVIHDDAHPLPARHGSTNW